MKNRIVDRLGIFNWNRIFKLVAHQPHGMILQRQDALSPTILTRTVVPSFVGTYPCRMRSGSAKPRHESPFTRNFLSISNAIALLTGSPPPQSSVSKKCMTDSSAVCAGI